MADVEPQSLSKRPAAGSQPDGPSTESSVRPSPLDSPRSLSGGSISSFEVEPSKPGQLVDSYGNPFELPNISIKDIHSAIPKHCFERSAVRSLSYVARDFIYLGTTFYLFNRFNTPEYVPATAARAVLWALYTVIQGLFATGVWVLAHECGHQAFSTSKVLNDFVGWVCHSLLLVPYFSWKISHGHHHKATGNLARDMVFVPRTREQQAERFGFTVEGLAELMEETPIVTAVHLLTQQLFGWPLYLITNVTGHNFHENQPEGKGKGKRNGFFGGVNHFVANSPLYKKREEKWILMSDLGLALVGGLLYNLGTRFGWANMAVWYFIPYLWVNHWLVAITFLQHTDPQLPHYGPEAWNYTRGAAATIDREFGFIGRHILHGIIETHVLHHFVSTIPFYHADEASDAIRPVLGSHYRSDTEGGSVGFLKAIWKSARWCQWVEPVEGAEGENKEVYFFRNRNKCGVAPAKMTKQQ